MVDNRKTRIGFLYKLLPLGILSAFALIVLIPLYASGNIHLFPHTFAVDNQQRLYLLFESGVYVCADDQSIRVLPRSDHKGKEQLYISEDNQMTFLHGMGKSVYDLDRSAPEQGDLFLIGETAITDESIFERSYGFTEMDEQNGAIYTYRQGLFTYSILREKDGESSLFYRMPHIDMLWDLILDAYILAMIAGILTVLYQYSKGHHAELVRRAEEKSTHPRSNR
ncbi:MAG: hypothetical protein GX417_04200 [Clostridiales bacterium]|nr:hypothetical protein [Clostridiales bacterium]